MTAEDWEREVEGVLEITVPPEFVVRVREGGGPENLAASLAVSVAKLAAAYCAARKLLEGRSP